MKSLLSVPHQRCRNVFLPESTSWDGRNKSYLVQGRGCRVDVLSSPILTETADSMWHGLYRVTSLVLDSPSQISQCLTISVSIYRILRTIRCTFFFEKLPTKFRCILYSKLINIKMSSVWFKIPASLKKAIYLMLQETYLYLGNIGLIWWQQCTDATNMSCGDSQAR